MLPAIEHRLMTASRWSSIIFVMIYASLVGCGKPAYSGFLRDYSDLKPDPAAEDALVYWNPGKPLKQYDKFIIDRVLVDFTPGAKGTTIRPEELESLAEYFRVQLEAKLSRPGRYQVVTAPGPGVLQIRVAITGIERTRVVASPYYKQTLAGVRMGGATMEAEGFDSESGVRVMAVVDSRKGDRVPIGEGMTDVEGARQVITYWVDRFIKRLDEAHGYSS